MQASTPYIWFVISSTLEALLSRQVVSKELSEPESSTQ